jgi:hypothetical protein
MRRLITRNDISMVGEPALLAGVRRATVSVQWRGARGMAIPFDSALVRNAVEAALVRSGVQISRDSRALYDSAGVDVFVSVTSFQLPYATVSSIEVQVLDMALVRRAQRHAAVLAIWVGGPAVFSTPPYAHEQAIGDNLRNLLDQLTIALSQAPAEPDTPFR